METIELELTDEEMLQLALQAHKQDITLNQHINNILRQVVEMYEEQDGFKTSGFDATADFGGSYEPI
jgi:hypothetical protein